ncbi:hypothetical protein BDD43_0589 [Mucilaginibacter gracilis]|uniref:PAS domain-containing protein n=1 Tax=Mucilaginibacter gracilis TaxID=423350 RepID=A0A495IVH1_9SPHI|nr:hypothetical protein BDD43_0589 [Mucilaginibacter gracilis]
MYLVLSPDLYIITASAAYLEATQTTRENIVGKHIFEAFPDNPDLPDGDDGMHNINASLQAVLHTKKPDPGQILPRKSVGPGCSFLRSETSCLVYRLRE